jgi:hypothetical protein
MRLIVEQEYTGVNADVLGTVTAALKLGEAQNIGIYILDPSFAALGAMFMLQISPDNGTTWFDTDHIIAAGSNEHDIVCIATHVRVNLTTRKGSAATVEIIIIAK